MTNETTKTTGTTKSVRAFARGAQLALWLQVIVAVVAVAAAVSLLIIVQIKGGEIERQTTAINAQKDLLKARSEAIGSLISVPSQIEGRQFDEGITAIEAALRALEQARQSGATSAADDGAFERPLRRAQAQLQNMKGDNAAAVATMLALTQLSGASETEAATERILLATYHCANADLTAARPILAAEIARDASVLDAFAPQSPCGPLLTELAPQQAASPQQPEDPAFKIRLAYLHIRNEAHRGAAIEIARQLCAAGYGMPGIQLIAATRPYPQVGDIRYYYGEQRAEAERIAQVVGQQPALPIRRLVGIDGLPKDRIEVWLSPQLAAGAVPGQRGFSCAPQANEDAAALSQSLAEQLNSEQREERLRAGELVAEQMRGSSPAQMTAALLAQLEGERLERLSASGRLNTLYMLNLRRDWSGADSTALAQRLDLIESRRPRVAIGANTQSCIDSLRAKLSGRGGRDTCGTS